MKKTRKRMPTEDEDTLRPEYDFSRAARGATAARYAEGANVVVIDPGVLDVFPDAGAVNETLRALAPIVRRRLRSPSKRGAGRRARQGGRND
jgi:hypothetical protein